MAMTWCLYVQLNAWNKEGSLSQIAIFDKSWKITYAETLRKPHWQELLTRAYACQCFAYAAGPYKGLPSWDDYRGLERGSCVLVDQTRKIHSATSGPGHLLLLQIFPWRVYTCVYIYIYISYLYIIWYHIYIFIYTLYIYIYTVYHLVHCSSELCNLLQ